jgi:hypothetical protein
MTCCGKPMQKDGNQYVCRKCGAWTDPGTNNPTTHHFTNTEQN